MCLLTYLTVEYVSRSLSITPPSSAIPDQSRSEEFHALPSSKVVSIIRVAPASSGRATAAPKLCATRHANRFVFAAAIAPPSCRLTVMADPAPMALTVTMLAPVAVPTASYTSYPATSATRASASHRLSPSTFSGGRCFVSVAKLNSSQMGLYIHVSAEFQRFSRYANAYGAVQ